LSRLGFAWPWRLLAFDNTAYVGIAAYSAILGANGVRQVAATTSDFDRNLSRSNSEMRPVAEKVATTTWRDEPAPAYAALGRVAIAFAASLKPISLTIRSRGNARQ